MTETPVTREQVMALQRALTVYGYDGEIDGRFGEKSYNAAQKALFDYHLRQLEPFNPTKVILPIELMQRLGVLPPLATPERHTVMGNILGGIFDGLLKNILKWELVQGYIRSALLTAGGWIGLDGFVGHDGTTTIVGAIMVILTVLWQAISNNQAKKAMDVVKAVNDHPEINVIPATETAANKPIVSVAKP